TPIVSRMYGCPSGSLGYVGRLLSYGQNRVVHCLSALLDRILGFVVNCCHVKSPEYWHIVLNLQYPTCSERKQASLETGYFRMSNWVESVVETSPGLPPTGAATHFVRCFAVQVFRFLFSVLILSGFIRA